jgi:hypothetical protein
MASMDFIYDIKEHLENQNQDYVIICVQRGQNTNLADLIYNVQNKESVQSIQDAIDKLQDDLYRRKFSETD